MREFLGNIDWYNELCDLNVQQQFDKFKRILDQTVAKYIPVKSKKK